MFARPGRFCSLVWALAAARTPVCHRGGCVCILNPKPTAGALHMLVGDMWQGLEGGADSWLL
jgi:hypothetical protein